MDVCAVLEKFRLWMVIATDASAENKRNNASNSDDEKR